MGFTILILVLPLLSFTLLGLAGKKMPHKVAGLIGTLTLAAVTVLSYYAAITFFAGGPVRFLLLPVLSLLLTHVHATKTMQ